MVMNTQALMETAIVNLSCYQLILECQNSIYGCYSCSNETVGLYNYLTCDQCFDGLYLLKNQTLLAAYPTYYTFCVPDCKTAHNSFVNDHSTGECQWCGEHCGSCNLNTGCENCLPAEQTSPLTGWVNFVSSSFSTCQRCTNSNSNCDNCLCETCSTSTDGECYSCPSLVSLDLLNEYCTGSPYPDTNSLLRAQPNCVSYDALYSKCLYCEDGYFVNAAGVCTLLIDMKCMYTSSTTGLSCSICEEYYSLSGSTCQSCLSLIGDTYFGEMAKCSITSGAATPIACRDGYVHPTTGLCVSKCPIGYYGAVTYNWRSYVEETKCVACSSNCYECMGPGTNQCTSCHFNFFLSHELASDNTYLSYGSCIQKNAGSCPSATAKVYVAPILYTTYSTGEDQNSKLGTPASPFTYLTSAITKAYEIGAPFTDCTVYIYMYLAGSGTYAGYYAHAMLRDSKLGYLPSASDTNSQTTKIWIGPEDGSSSITIYYKMRDKFKFKVGGGLTLKNILFDATDSMYLNDADGCFSYPNGCCTVDTDYWYVKQFTSPTAKTASCSFNYRLTEECVIPQGASFIEFDIHKNTLLTAPPTLTITGCSFSNFLYEFNSFIQLNDYGGYIVISDSKFENFNTCGSIVRNKDQDYEDSTTPTNYPTYFSVRMNNLQKEVYDVLYESFTAYICTECFSIDISDSEFNYFGMMKANYTSYTPIKVDPSYKMQYTGLVLDLDGFEGPVTLDGNTFQSNILGYYSCGVSVYLDENLISDVTTDNYWNFGSSKTKFQIKSVISIVNHEYMIDILSNNFYNNSGTKGIIYLDVLPLTTNGVSFYKNSFQKNSGYIDSSVIYIRARSATSITTTLPTDANLYCTGFDFTENSFYMNYGCSERSGGVIKFECVDSADSSSDANDRIDASTNAFDSTITNSLCYTMSQTYSTVSSLSNRYAIDMHKLNFYRNSFSYNFGTNGAGLVDIVGAPRVYMSQDSYSGNGDTAYEVINYIQSGVTINVSDTSGAYFNFNSELTMEGALISAQDPSTFMKSLISIKRSVDVYLDGLSFTANWLLETTFTDDRSQLIYFDEIYGRLQIYGSSKDYPFAIKYQYGLKQMYQKQIGMIYSMLNNEAVASQLSDSTSDFYYGSGLPLIKKTSDFCISNSIINIAYFNLSDSTFQEVAMSSVSDAYVFDFGATGNIYDIDSFTIGDSTTVTQKAFIYNIECYLCSQPLFKLTSKTINILTTYIAYINYNAYEVHYIRPTVPPFQFTMRKPYTQSLVTTIETLTFSNDQFGSNYGRLMEIETESITGEYTPMTAQITFSTVTIGYQYIREAGGFAYIDADQFIMEISSCTIANTIGDLMIKYNGAYFYLNALASVSITLSNLNYLSQYLGEGIFIYYNTDSAFSLSVSSSVFSDTSSSQLTTISMTSQILRGSLFYLNGISKSITLSSNNNQYQYQAAATYGGVYYIKSTSKNSVSFNTDQFQYNQAIYGGSIYCYYCEILAFTSVSFTSGKAYNGGDLYLENPYSALAFSDYSTTSAAVSNQGGSIYIKDTSTTTTTQLSISQTNIATQLTSSAGYDGGFVYIDCIFGVSLSLTSLSISAQSTNGNGGIFCVSNSMTGTSSVSISGGYISATTALNGGAFYIPSTASTSTITTSGSTQISSTYASNDGGVIYSAASMSNTISISSSTLSMPSSSLYTSNSGGVIYIDSAGTVTVTDSTIQYYQAIYGGLVYYGPLSTSASLSFTSSYLYGYNAATYGGLFYFSASVTTASLSFTSTTIANYTATQEGSFFYSSSYSLALSLSFTSSSFACQHKSLWDSITSTYNYYLDSLNGNNKIGSLFYYQNTTTGSISVSSTTFKQCYNSRDVSIFSIPPTISLTVSNSVFKETMGIFGVIRCYGCSTTITGTQFKDNIAQYGGVLYLVDGANVAMTGCEFINGKAVYSGAFAHATYSMSAIAASLTISSCLNYVQYYETYLSNGGFIYSNNALFSFSSSSCNFDSIQSYSKGGLIYSEYISSISIAYATMSNITGSSDGLIIYTNSNIPTITLTFITHTCASGFTAKTVSSALSSMVTTTTSYPLYYFNQGIILTQSSSTYSSCSLAQSGGIFYSNGGTFTDTSNSYTSIGAFDGAIYYCISCVITATSMTVNTAYSQYGGIFFIKGSGSTLSINGLSATTLWVYYKGGIIYQNLDSSTDTCEITMTGTITTSSVKSSYHGGMFYLQGSSTTFSMVLSSSSLLSDTSANSGSIAYLEDIKSFSISGAGTFYKTKASSLGSVVYLSTVNYASEISLSDAIFDCQATSTVSTTTEYTAIYLSGSSTIMPTLTMSKATIKNCFYGTAGGALYSKYATITDSGSTFDNNAGNDGGAVYLYYSTATFSGSIFKNNQAAQGGVFYLYETATLTVNSGASIKTSTASNGGAVLYAYSMQNTNSIVINMDTVTIDTAASSTSGGVFYITSTGVSLTAKTLTVKSVTSSNNGGVVFMATTGTILIQDSEFTDIAASQGSLFYSYWIDVQFTLKDSKIYCMSTNLEYLYSNVYGIYKGTITYDNDASAIYSYNNQQTITLTSNKFYYCYIAQNGGAVYVYTVNTFIDTGSTYTKCGASTSGGALYIYDVPYVTLNSLTFDGNAALNGGAIYIDQSSLDSDITFDSLTFTYCFTVNNGGCIYLGGSKSMTTTLTKMTVSKSEAYVGRGSIIYSSNPSQQLVIKSSTISGTSNSTLTTPNMIYIQGISLTIDDTDISGIYGTTYGTLVYAPYDTLYQKGTNLYVYDSNIQCDSSGQYTSSALISSYKLSTITPTIESPFYLEQPVEVDLWTNTYSNCYLASYGGVFYLDYSQSNTATFKDQASTYKYNAAYYGGAIYVDNYSSPSITITILDCTFTSNYGQNGGILAYVQTSSFQTIYSISFSYSKFSGNQAFKTAGLFYISSTSQAAASSNFYLGASTVSSTTVGTSGTCKGGLFYIDDQYSLGTLEIYKTDITSTTCTSGSGGVLYFNQIYSAAAITISGYNSSYTASVFSADSQGSFLYSSGFIFKLIIKNAKIRCYSSAPTLSQTTAIGSAFYMVFPSTTYDALDSEATEYLTITDSQFENCYSKANGGVFQIQNIYATIDNSDFNYNYAKGYSGGVIYADSSQIKITDSSFYGNYAQKGGAIYINDNDIVTISNTDFQQNQASQYGGAIAIEKTSTSSITTTYDVQISDCDTIAYNYASSGGGFMYLSNLGIQVTISDSTIKYQYAAKGYTTGFGGAFYIIESPSLTITDCTLENFYGYNGAILYSSSSSLQLVIKDSTIVCNSTFTTTDATKKLDVDDEEPLYNYTTAFYISDAQSVTSTSNTFTQCATAYSGAVFQIKDAEFYDFYSEYTFNAGVYGGVFSCSKCTSSFYKTSFTYNLANRGGVIHLEQSGYALFESVMFTKNIAYSEAGVLYAQTGSYFDMDDCELKNNYASLTSTISTLKTNTTANITINSTYFITNSATKNTLSFMYSNVYLRGCYFNQNKATERTKNIFTAFSSIYIIQSQFNGITYSNQTLQASTEETMGTFLFVSYDTYVYIYKSTFTKGTALSGGAVYVSGSSILDFYDCTFTSNYAKTQGGAIYAEDFTSIKIASNSSTSKFASNYALKAGDDLYFSNSVSFVELYSVTITNQKAHSSIYASQVNFKSNNLIMSGMNSGASTQGAAIYFENCDYINITKSTFSDMKSQEGGTIYIYESDNSKNSSIANTKYMIYDSKFSNSYANAGGTLYINNPQSMLISGTTFTSSTAKNTTLSSVTQSGIGGAIYYTCGSLSNCKLTIKGGSKFTQCTSDFKGGAIYWDILEPTFSSDLSYVSNKAYLYGDNIASFAQKLVKITLSQYYAHLQSLGLYNPDSESQRFLDTLVTNSTLSNLQSGGTIPTVYIAHVDKYDQIVGSDFSSKVTVSVDSTYTLSSSASKYSPILEGSTSFTSVGGAAIISDVKFAARPGYTYRLSFSTDGIDTSKKSNSDYMKSSSLTDIDYKLTIGLRECEVGEYFTSAGKCIECEAGVSYSLVQMTSPGDCTACPTTKATCIKGSEIGPNPGYWRKNNVTSTFVKCLNTDACLGMIPPTYDPLGECADGYQGILCADCQDGYSRTGSYECSLCPEATGNAFKLIGILILAIGLISFMVRSTLAGAKDKNNVTSIFQKIIMNHFQLIILTASFNFDWPDQVTSFFNVSKPVAQASTQIISIDCFLSTRIAETNVTRTQTEYVQSEIKWSRIFFIKLVIISLLPFLIAAVCFGFWNFYKLIRRQSHSVFGKSLSTLVIILFFVHPNIVQYMFYNFKCLTVDGDSRVEDDLEIVCWSSVHKFYSLFVAVPSIIVWGLGIPFFAFLLLTRIRKSLDKLESREKLGFLYRGYKKDFFFWEVIIMYRKIALICISVFISSYGVVAQALIVFMLLILFLFFNMKKQPYQTTVLNDLETLSLITSMITIYCGLFFISDIPQEWINAEPDMSDGALQLSEEVKLFFFAIIVFSNIVFFAYWIYQMLREVQAKFRAKLPKVYLYLCLCNNKAKLELELRRHSLLEENEFLKEEYFKMIDLIEKSQQRGRLILNQHSLDKLKIYLREENIIAIAGHVQRQSTKQIEKNNKRKERLHEGNIRNLVNGLKTKGGPQIDADFQGDDIQQYRYTNMGEEDQTPPSNREQNLIEKYQTKRLIQIDEEFLDEGCSRETSQYDNNLQSKGLINTKGMKSQDEFYHPQSSIGRDAALQSKLQAKSSINVVGTVKIKEVLDSSANDDEHKIDNKKTLVEIDESQQQQFYQQDTTQKDEYKPLKSYQNEEDKNDRAIYIIQKKSKAEKKQLEIQHKKVRIHDRNEEHKQTDLRSTIKRLFSEKLKIYPTTSEKGNFEHQKSIGLGVPRKRNTKLIDIDVDKDMQDLQDNVDSEAREDEQGKDNGEVQLNASQDGEDEMIIKDTSRQNTHNLNKNSSDEIIKDD